MPQPSQCNWHFLLVTAAYAISDDIDLVASSKKVDRGLRDANVTLDADDDGGDWPVCAERIEGFLDVWSTVRGQRLAQKDESGAFDRHHGEEGLVGVDKGLNALRRVELELRACLS